MGSGPPSFRLSRRAAARGAREGRPLEESRRGRIPRPSRLKVATSHLMSADLEASKRAWPGQAQARRLQEIGRGPMNDHDCRMAEAYVHERMRSAARPRTSWGVITPRWDRWAPATRPGMPVRSCAPCRDPRRIPRTERGSRGDLLACSGDLPQQPSPGAARAGAQWFCCPLGQSTDGTSLQPKPDRTRSVFSAFCLTCAIRP